MWRDFLEQSPGPSLNILRYGVKATFPVQPFRCRTGHPECVCIACKPVETR